jgi:DNA topoisomerase-2
MSKLVASQEVFTNKTTGDVEDYKEWDEINHILKNSTAMFLGNTSSLAREVYKYKEGKIVKTTIEMSRAFEQLFLEGLGNAVDAVYNSQLRGKKDYRIEINVSDTEINIISYAIAIPVEKKQSLDGSMLYTPQILFGRLRTTTNKSDGAKRFFISKNGYGAKLINIFSKKFEVVCSDPDRKKIYKGTWANNMTQFLGEDVIDTDGKNEPFVSIRYTMDFGRFDYPGITDDMLSIFIAYAYSASFTCNTPVVFNNMPIHMTSFQDYVKMFLDIDTTKFLTYYDTKEGYEFFVVDTTSDIQIGFVNGVMVNYGVHMDAIYAEMLRYINAHFKKLLADVKIEKRHVVPHTAVFLTCRLNNPDWEGQSKGHLTKPKPNIKVPDSVFKDLNEWELMNKIRAVVDSAYIKQLEASDAKKGERVELPGMWEANWAGDVNANKRNQTILFMTEGKSGSNYQKTFSNLDPDGKNKYGRLPLRGKFINVFRDPTKAINNKEYKLIKQFVGLEEKLNYETAEQLAKIKYGKIAIATDADDDGIHITGLLLVFFCKKAPGLVKAGRLFIYLTPIVRIYKKSGGVHAVFYSQEAFKKYIEANVAEMMIPGKYKFKYYKGLGSNSDDEIALDAKNPRFVPVRMTDDSMESLRIGFDNTSAQDRKTWLRDWMKREIFDYQDASELSITTFVKEVLPIYVVTSIYRAIPDILDGIKEGQRKALYACMSFLKEGSDKKVNVCCGHIIEKTNYKHGDTSLQATVVKMAQKELINMEYFKPGGQFGKYEDGGKAGSNPRYISISLNWWIPYVYMQDDVPLLQNIKDEGELQEYYRFYPILPMHVVNGCHGVATAFSVNIPQHHPLDVCLWLLQRIKKEISPKSTAKLPFLKPWFKNFRGTVKVDEVGGRYYLYGNYEKTKEGRFMITELPYGVWQDEYIQKLIKWKNEKKIGRWSDDSSDKNGVRITITGPQTPIAPVSLRSLGLIGSGKYTNMSVVIPSLDNNKIQIKVYRNINDLMEDFFRLRLDVYRKRIVKNVEIMKADMDKKKMKMKFIEHVIQGKLIITKRPEDDIKADMKRLNLDENLLANSRANSFTTNAISKLQAEIDELLKKINYLEVNHPAQIWADDINRFKDKYCEVYGEKMRTLEDCPYPTPEDVSAFANLKRKTDDNIDDEIIDIDSMLMKDEIIETDEDDVQEDQQE